MNQKKTGEANLEARVRALEGIVRGAGRVLKVVAVGAVLGWSATLAAQGASWAPAGFNVFSSGSPAVATEVNDNFRWLVEHVQQAAPAGTVVAFAGSTVPLGWLLCDGREVASSEYPELAVALGNTWGSAAEDFVKLPDLRGQFLRGVNRGVGLEPGRVLGTSQGFAMENLSGTLPRIYVDSASGFLPTGVFSWTGNGNRDVSVSGGADSYATVEFDAASMASTADETRPDNMAVDFIIKY